MLASQLLFPTLREEPGEAVIASHRLLLRAAFIKKLASGLYILLPIGLRVFERLEAIIREEMNAAGAVEVRTPLLIPAALWQKSGRWDAMGTELFRIKDRNDSWNVLGPTHEETLSEMMNGLIKSYRDLPKNIYQIGAKFRDEIRPRFGLIRSRQFVMKDAYSFHVDEGCLDKTYQEMRRVYREIFTRMQLNTVAVEADSGAMGGSLSEEFMVISEIGEETLLFSEGGRYRANIESVPILYSAAERTELTGKRESFINEELAEKGRSSVNEELAGEGKPSVNEEPTDKERLSAEEGLDGNEGLNESVQPTKDARQLEEFYTPEVTTISQLAALLKIKTEQILKSVVYIGDGRLFLVCISGDRDVNEVKLKKHIMVKELQAATDAQMLAYGLSPGFIGPLGLERNKAGLRSAVESLPISILWDLSTRRRGPWVIGANRADYHYGGYVAASDRQLFDLALARAGDLSPVGDGILKEARGIEVGHIFKLGDKYSRTFQLRVLDAEGNSVTPIMGCYGIGLERSMAAVVEQHHDDRGICWPITVAPFEMVLISIFATDEERLQTEKLYRLLLQKNCTILWDDRSLRPGVKFYDAELIGFPIRITMGKRYFRQGELELQLRRSGENLILKGDMEKLCDEIVKIRKKLYEK